MLNVSCNWKGFLRKVPSLHQEVGGILLTRGGEFQAEKAIQQTWVILHEFTAQSLNPFVLSVLHKCIVCSLFV